MFLYSLLNFIWNPKSYVAVTVSSFTLRNCPHLIFDWIIRAYLRKVVCPNRWHSSISVRTVLGLPISINLPLLYTIHVNGNFWHFYTSDDFLLMTFDSCGSRMSKFSLTLYNPEHTMLLYFKSIMIFNRNTSQPSLQNMADWSIDIL